MRQDRHTIESYLRQLPEKGVKLKGNVSEGIVAALESQGTIYIAPNLKAEWALLGLTCEKNSGLDLDWNGRRVALSDGSAEYRILSVRESKYIPDKVAALLDSGKKFAHDELRDMGIIEDAN